MFILCLYLVLVLSEEAVAQVIGWVSSQIVQPQSKVSLGKILNPKFPPNVSMYVTVRKHLGTEKVTAAESTLSAQLSRKVLYKYHSIYHCVLFW